MVKRYARSCGPAIRVGRVVVWRKLNGTRVSGFLILCPQGGKRRSSNYSNAPWDGGGPLVTP